MPTIPDDAKPKINSEFVRRLEAVDPPTLDVLVETEPGRAGELTGKVLEIQGVSLGWTGIISGKYFPAVVPQERIPDVARLDGVVTVHQDQPAGVMDSDIRGRDFPFLTTERDPIRTALSDALYEAFDPSDEFGFSHSIGRVEVPRFNFAQLPPGDPLQTAFKVGDKVTGEGLSGEKIIPTAEAVEWTRNSNLTDGAIKNTTKVAIIDTGHSPTEPENGGRAPHLESMVPGEPPLDMMGHGSWCTNMVTGYPAPGPWGTTVGVAPGSVYGHFKALNTFPGFGKTSWIMKAMERALNWGADVISMSLGGTQQGAVGEDPYTRFIADNCKENAGDEDGAIFVVAAGNAGPDTWTIGSPGISPHALTVASWSLTDEAPAIFSSRGPQGSYYSDKADEFESDMAEYGADRFVKPDVAAPGGGRDNQDRTDTADEILFQSSVGWYDGLKDGLKDNRASMKGTCLTGDVRVLAADGRPVPIEDIEPGEEVLSYDDGEMVSREVNALMNNGEQQVYDLCVGANEITATANHPFLCLSGDGGVEWKQVSEMTTDDSVVVNKTLPDHGEPMPLSPAADGGVQSGGAVLSRPEQANGRVPAETTEDFARFVGFWLGDGWFNEQTRSHAIMLAAGEREAVDSRYTSLAESVFGLKMKERRQDGRVLNYYASAERVYRLFDRLDLDRGVYDKHIPEWAFALPHSQQKALIGGLVDADGWVTPRDRADQYGVEVTSEQLARDLHRMVQNLGWKASKVTRRKREIQPPNSPEPVESETWVVTFYKSRHKYGSAKKGRQDMDYERFYARPVRGIEPAGEEVVYDIEVEGAHNFLAEGVVVHNSMATPNVAGLVKRLYDAGIVNTAADVKQVVSERQSFGQFPEAASGANQTRGGKNVAIGFGPVREALFEPSRVPSPGKAGEEAGEEGEENSTEETETDGRAASQSR